MKLLRMLSLFAAFATWTVVAHNAFASNRQPTAPSFTGLKDWIQAQRPPKTSLDSEFKLPAYPDWYGRCSNPADLMTGFAREFKRECIDEISRSTIKSIGEGLEATRTFSNEVRSVISLCTEKIDDRNLSPKIMAQKLIQCNNAAKDIKQKADGALEQGNKLSDVSSREQLTAFLGIAEKLTVSLSTCTLKAMLTADDMTERQKKDRKEEVDSILRMWQALPAGFDAASHMSQMAATIAKNGLEYFQTEKINDLEDVLIGLDKLSISETARKQGEEFLKSLRFGAFGRNLTLAEKGQEIALLMNSCQVNQAMSNLEIFRNMVSQEFLEQRWAITKDEKNLWCAAQARGYDRIFSNNDKWAFLTGSTIGLSPSHSDFAKYYNPERDRWRDDLKTQQNLIKKISKVNEEFSLKKIQAARQQEKRERTLIMQLTDKTISLVDDQCKDVSTNGYFQELDMTGKRLVRARDSNCGQAGLAAEYKLDMLVRILDIIKKQTDTQLNIRQETVAEINSHLSFCKPSEAQRALEAARKKMDAMKPDRQKIDDELAKLKSKDKKSTDTIPAFRSSDTANIAGYDRCYASTFSMAERQIKDEQNYLEVFLKKIDAEIQPARRALEKCEGSTVLPGLHKTRTRLTAKQCNSAPGITLRLREIHLLEQMLAPEKCKASGRTGCLVTPDTVTVQPGKYYKISTTFWGSDGGAHCLTEAEAKALNAQNSTNASLIGDGSSCTTCPKGFRLVNDNSSQLCVQCPKGKSFSNGCCL